MRDQAVPVGIDVNVPNAARMYDYYPRKRVGGRFPRCTGRTSYVCGQRGHKQVSSTHQAQLPEIICGSVRRRRDRPI